jgi:hypothetical protein
MKDNQTNIRAINFQCEEVMEHREDCYHITCEEKTLQYSTTSVINHLSFTEKRHDNESIATFQKYGRPETVTTVKLLLLVIQRQNFKITKMEIS